MFYEEFDDYLEEEEEVFDPFFNSAREYPEYTRYITLDPLAGSYQIIPISDSESSETEVVPTASASTNNEAGNGEQEERSFNEQILLAVEKIDAKVNAFRAELDEKLKSLLDANERQRTWQAHINLILSMIVTDLEN